MHLWANDLSACCTAQNKPAEFKSEVIKANRAPVWYTKPAPAQPSKDGRTKPVEEPAATFSHKDAPKLCLEARSLQVEVCRHAFAPLLCCICLQSHADFECSRVRRCGERPSSVMTSWDR